MEATSDALMGHGMPAQLAATMGAQPNLQAGVGTNALSGAAIIKSKNTELNPQAGATAFTFASTVGVSEPFYLVNPQTTTAVIGIPTGHTLTTASAGSTPGLNGIISLATMKAAIVWQYKPKFWTFILTT